MWLTTAVVATPDVHVNPMKTVQKGRYAPKTQEALPSRFSFTGFLSFFLFSGEVKSSFILSHAVVSMHLLREERSSSGLQKCEL